MRKFGGGGMSRLSSKKIPASAIWIQLIVIAVTTLSCRRSPEPLDPAPSLLQLRDISEESGIRFQHVDGSSGQRYIVESMSTGIATFDYDLDGRIDIYLPNGAALPGTTYESKPRHALYRNLGDCRFRDVTDQAGITATAFGLGVTVGDFNNDGWPDIYLNNFGPGILYRNNGDGTFSDVTEQAGVSRGHVVGAGACFLDADADGALDLFVGNYIDLDLSQHVPHVTDGYPTYPSPKEYAPLPDTLYHNRGDGTFTDASESTGIASQAGRSMGMVCADIDDDGDTDLFVLNDVQESYLWQNDGHGNFSETGLVMGVAVNGAGEAMANMGVDCGDYDNDGRLDFYSTNYQLQWPLLFRNTGEDGFEDVASMTNAGAGCYPLVNWGCGLVDFDNDGWLDIFIGQGHIEDNIDERDATTSYRCTNTLLQNTGQGRFEDISARCGLSNMTPHAARGTAFEDLDNDGDVDVVVLNSRERPSVIQNRLRESGSDRHWIQLRICGVAANRDGVGSRVRVVSGDLELVTEVHSGRGYQSHWGSRLHFGLGSRTRIDRVEVDWMGGGRDIFENLAVDRIATLIEGNGASEDSR